MGWAGNPDSCKMSTGSEGREGDLETRAHLDVRRLEQENMENADFDPVAGENPAPTG